MFNTLKHRSNPLVAVALIALLLSVLGLVREWPGHGIAHAQTLSPTTITISDTGNAGEVMVKWNGTSDAQGYRVGWASERAVLSAVAAGVPWQERFAFTDLRPVVTSHTVQNLMGGERYAFLVGTRVSPTTYSWSEWQFHVTAASPVCPASPPSVAKQTITFGDLNWSSALLQNRIAQYIVEEGYGYPTHTLFGSTLPLFQALRSERIDVLMEIWLPNQDEAWEAARAEGEVISLGRSLEDDWQSAFVIPAYLQRQHPGLDSVDDLKNPRYKRLFATPQTDGRARLVSCVSGWRCETINRAQIRGYGLSDHVQIINPPDGAALNADLYRAYERGEPWLGYQWRTNDPALLLDLVRLREPEYSHECWYTTKACAYQDATVLIATHPAWLEQAPDVAAMLRNWDFNHATHKAVTRWQADNPDARVEDAALWWLNNNDHIWRNWVTAKAARSIQTALNSGETPDGWPRFDASSP